MQTTLTPSNQIRGLIAHHARPTIGNFPLKTPVRIEIARCAAADKPVKVPVVFRTAINNTVVAAPVAFIKSSAA